MLRVVEIIATIESRAEGYGPFVHDLVRLDNGCTAYVKPGTLSLDEPEWWKGEPCAK